MFANAKEERKLPPKSSNNKPAKDGKKTFELLIDKDLCKVFSTIRCEKPEEMGPYLSAVLTVGQVSMSLRAKTGDHCPDFQNAGQIIPAVNKVMKSYREMRKAKNLVNPSPNLDAEFFSEINDKSLKAKRLVLPKYDQPKPKPKPI
mmetsp:Transcript_18531/g.28461  ORF Transcript_18531/g.28461 Transcript_18531/m.28461 type:complete len:146 (+) Transcript_18531:56-493(+)